MDVLVGAGLVATTSSAWLPFWLLVAGHLLGDFLFQSGWMVANKRRGRGLPVHVAVVVVIHLAVLAPYVTPGVVVVVLGVGLLHLLVDLAKSRFTGRRPGQVGLFVADQAVHLLVLFAAYLAIVFLGITDPHFREATVRAWTAWALLLGGLAFNTMGGSVIVSATLRSLSPGLEAEDRGERGDEGVPGSGHRIGTLERTLTLVLVLIDQWGAIGLLLAAKSIARYEALRKRQFAEYFLIGTLTSLLVAILVALVLRVLVIGG